jgi:3-hydroxy-9,10-secoandrosta-1,3,5(10)-triene-9,17-dione monooxygenase
VKQQATSVAIVPEAPPDRAELVHRARALAPKLRERAAQSEALRHVPDETIPDLAQSGVLKSAQPTRFGGSGLGLDAVCEIAMELGKGDGSQGWVANIYALMGYFVGLFDERVQREVWGSNPNALIAGSIVPHGNKACACEGGYRLAGRWGFTSGVQHADWVAIAEMTNVDDGPPQFFNFLLPASDCRIVDDWHTVGMVGTGSASVELDDVFVPAYRGVSQADIMAGKTPGARVNREPIYRMPLLGYAQLGMAAVPVGAAMGMLEDFRASVAQGLKAPNPAPGLELLQERFSRSAAELQAARLLILDASRTVMVTLERGEYLVEADAARSLRDSGYAIVLAKQAAARLFEAIGGRGLYLSGSMQRAFRDVLAGGAHASLGWEKSALRYARSILAHC